MRTLLQSITGDPVLCIVIAAAVTWAAHSSVATVLLDHVARVFALHHAAGGAGAGAGRQSGQRDQSGDRRRQRDDPASYRLPVGNLINRLVGIVLVVPFLPALTACAAVDAARPRQADRAVPHRVQRRAGAHLHRPARSAGLAAEQAVPDAAGVRQPLRAALSRRERARDAHRSRSPMQRAKRCGWATSSRTCSATSCWR